MIMRAYGQKAVPGGERDHGKDSNGQLPFVCCWHVHLLQSLPYLFNLTNGPHVTNSRNACSVHHNSYSRTHHAHTTIHTVQHICWAVHMICLGARLVQKQKPSGCTRANAPARGRALALAGMCIYAGNHQGMPCALGQSRLNFTIM